MLQGYFAGGVLGKRFGVFPDGPAVGMAAAFTLVLLLVLWIPYTRFVLGSSGASFRRLWRGVRGSLLATLVMGFVVWALRGMLPETLSPPLRLVVLVLSGVVVYWFIARREVRWGYEFFGFSRGNTGSPIH
jgi:hypothetical protein